MKNRKRVHLHLLSILFLSVLFAVIVSVQAQQPPPVTVGNPTKKMIELRRAGVLTKRANSEAQILIDSVILYHEGAYMYCDSAYMYEKTNSFEAFSNVRMEQGDTIFVYGDYLHYDGNTKLARLRNNIRMEDKKATLFTDSLDYDRAGNLGYYFDGGMLVDDKNELTSFWGQYNPGTKEALFSDSVKLVNPEYTIFSDTLKYNTETKIADILGPSVIVSDSGFIHTQHGWYNTNTDDAHLFDRSKVYSKDSTKVLIGDTIFYNRQNGHGEVFGDMYLEDTKKKAILRGNYGFYNEKTEYGMATDSAYAIEYSQKDSLFLHGDTLIMQTDSTFRDLKAFYNVRFFRSDMQGLCDSLHYASKDSILYLVGEPVIWNQSNQILGGQIDVYMNDSTVDKAIVKEYALAVQNRNLDEQYNQMSGSKMTAFFKKGDINHVLAEGNAQSLYYLLDEKDSTIVGLNKTESAYLSIDIANDEIQKLKLWSATQATTTPLPQLNPEDAKLKGFVWLDYLRPKNKLDIFRSNKRNASDNVTPPPSRFVREEEEENRQ